MRLDHDEAFDSFMRHRMHPMKRSLRHWTIGGILAITLVGCVSTNFPTIPPVTRTATGVIAPGKIVSHELATLDVEKSKAFYGAVFGWTFLDLPGKPRGYTVVLSGGEPIGGMFQFLSNDPGKHASEWIPAISVADVDGAVATARDHGATILAEPHNFPDRGRMSLLADPQRAVFFLLRSSYGDPTADIGAVNSWLWDELWTKDPTAALGFYGQLFSLTHTQAANSQNTYSVISVDGVPRAGVAELKAEGIRPHWLPIIRVDDAVATVAKALTAGGVVLIEPRETARGGKSALLLDATGAPIGVQEYRLKN
jgi:uncharacterized protein